MFNFAGEYASLRTTQTMDTIYTTFGEHVSQNLEHVDEYEGTVFNRIVRDSVNYRLGFWTAENGADYILYSDVLSEENAVVGTSEVVVTYIDTITRSEFNMTYPLTILDTGTYYHYVALGVITETEATT